MDDYRIGYIDGEANRNLEVEGLKQQLAAKDALLRKSYKAFLQFTSRESMDDLESFGYSADAVIEAIDKELGK